VARARTDATIGAASSPEIITPPLPPARFVQLDERGTVLVRDFGGPAGAPTVVLLHGWTATADLNWFRCYSALGEHYRVIAFDHRGHGTGIRSRKKFRLEDCADDVVDVAEVLGVDRFIAVGYSMGGPVAQLLWRRHPDVIDGLVLCATAARFSGRREERIGFMGLTGLAAMARITPDQAKLWLTDQFFLQRKSKKWEPWAIREASHHDWRMVLEAGRALGSFSSVGWIGSIDVPVANVITMRDSVVPLDRQTALYELIPDAAVFRVDGAHDAVVANAERFVPTLLRAIDSVERRVDRHARRDQP
jgi:pimeloyl-ACP methyl ester carboxylesterase